MENSNIERRAGASPAPTIMWKSGNVGGNIPLVPPAAKHSPFEGGLRGMLCFVFLLFLSSVPAFSWTQTDWASGDSQCLWYAADRYDTGVYIDTGVSGQISIDTNISEGELYDTGVLLSSTFDADSPVVWKTIEWNDPSVPTGDGPYRRGDSRLRKDETTGLVALWHFDEGENLAGGTSADDSTVYDESTYSNTGIVYGCKWGDASEDSAVFQSALSFDGDGDYVDCGNKSSLDITSEITIEAWVKASALQTGSIIYKSNTYVTNQDYALFVHSNGNVYFRIGNGTSYGTALFAYTTDNWFHIVGTYDGSTLRIYKNGIEEDTDISISGNIDNSANDIIIGRRTVNSTKYFYNGAIDEVAIYSRAKTAEEIWQDARGTQIRLRTQTTSSILDGTGADSPVGLWHFDDLVNSDTADDSSVYGNDGHLGGTSHTVGALPTWSQNGVFGKCLSFDGDDYVEIATNPVSGEDEMTFEAWVKFNVVDVASSGENTVFGSWVTPAFLLFIDGDTTPNDGLRLLVRDTDGNKDFTWDTVPSVDTWYHIAFTYKRNDYLRLYIDGSEVENTATDDQPLVVNTSAIYIGWDEHSSHDKFNGYIDEVAIYPRAKTADEIKIDARSGSPWSPWSPYYKKGDEDDIVLFADDFNDGNVGIGSNWTTSDPWLIDKAYKDSGVLEITTTALDDTGIIRASDNTDWYNYQVETKVKLEANTLAGILLNWTDGTQGYAAILNNVTNRIEIYTMSATGVATLKDHHSFNFTTDYWYTLKAQYDGSHIRVYLGDKNYITYNVTDYTYKGYAGLIAAGNAKAYFDDFKVFPIDRYVRYEATLTDNMCNDTTPYLYWVRLTYEDTTSDDSIWSRIWQDRYGTHNGSNRWCPEDAVAAGEPSLNYAEIDSADTTWCYNLENYDSNNGRLRVFVETLKTTNYLNLRLGYRKTSALSAHPNTWPEDIDDYEWSDWMKFKPTDVYGDCDVEYTLGSADTEVWQCTLDTTQMTNNFSTEAGYILQSRAVSNDESTEPDPSNFQPDSTTKDRQDTSIIYVMRDITPPGSEYSEGGVDGYVSASGYTAETCAASGANTLWTNVGVKGIISKPEDATYASYKDNNEYVWFNIDSSAHDSGIRVKVLDQNQATDRLTDCSGLDEDDTSIRYRYSVSDPVSWKGLNDGDAVSNVATWAKADTNIWTDANGDNRYMVIQDNIAAKTDDDNSIYPVAGNYRYSIACLDPGLPDRATKGENVLIQFAQKDKAGNWGYSHRDNSHSATQTAGSSTNKGYYINVDLLAPVPLITAGPREANYSSSASFEFKDDSANDSPLLCAFSTQLEENTTPTRDGSSYDYVDPPDCRWTAYHPWSPTSDEGSATYTDIPSSSNWYRCLVKAKDEALNESDGNDTYYFQCLPKVPNTIIYSGPAGIVTSPTSTYSATFKFKAEGGTPAYLYAYKFDGDADWTLTTSPKVIPSLGYGNHTFRVRAANKDGDPTLDSSTDIDQTPASVTFTIEDPDKPSTIAPPSDPVKYWREESE